VRRGSRFEMYYTGKGFRISFRKRLKAEGVRLKEGWEGFFY